MKAQDGTSDQRPAVPGSGNAGHRSGNGATQSSSTQDLYTIYPKDHETAAAATKVKDLLLRFAKSDMITTYDNADGGVDFFQIHLPNKQQAQEIMESPLVIITRCIGGYFLTEFVHKVSSVTPVGQGPFPDPSTTRSNPNIVRQEAYNDLLRSSVLRDYAPMTSISQQNGHTLQQYVQQFGQSFFYDQRTATVDVYVVDTGAQITHEVCATV